nr:helix-turn-helix transcriptional regulator [Halalkalibacterium ligniniphilum]
MTIKSNLKEILDERNLSVLKVSKDIGYRYESVRTFYTDENKQYPKELLDKLCDYLDVTPGDLIKYEKEPNSN